MDRAKTMMKIAKTVSRDIVTIVIAIFLLQIALAILISVAIFFQAINEVALSR